MNGQDIVAQREREEMEQWNAKTDPNYRLAPKQMANRLHTENTKAKPHAVKPDPGPAQPQGLCVVSAMDLLVREIPPREWLLSPWLPTQGLAMIHAWRGVGKTHVAMGIACAVACGGSFLGWKAPKPRSVLFLDGEMPAATLQERVRDALAIEGLKPRARLDIVTPDFQANGMPDLATPEGRTLVDKHIAEDVELVLVDNLSTLVRSGKENEGESWEPIQTWALRWRARRKTIVFVHHSGKGGLQRGTSKREDVLDAVIALAHPASYTPDQGACFNVKFEKARGVFGKDAAPFEAALLKKPNGEMEWAVRTLENSRLDSVRRLRDEGFAAHEIAEQLGVHKSTISRDLKKLD